MEKRIVSQPKRCTFKTACRYLNIIRTSFMGCWDGYGWKLYRYTGPSPPNSVGYEGRPYIFIAYVDETPDDHTERKKYRFWGNHWSNPRRLR